MAEVSIDALPRSRKEAKAVGSSHYFTGRSCGNDHLVARITGSGRCLECNRDGARKWRGNHKEKAREIDRSRRLKSKDKIREYRRSYYDNNRALVLEKQRVYSTNNRDKVRASSRRRRLADPDKYREECRAWRAANPERNREHVREWRKANPDKLRAQHQNRRALKRGAEGKHTSADIVRIRGAQRDRCAMPGCRVRLNGSGDLDHIIALSKGGTNWPRNLQLLCHPCNNSKHARDPIEFAQSRGFLV